VPASRRDLASSLRALDIPVPERPRRARSAAADDAELARLRRELRAHPVHGCAEREDHLRWAERWNRLRRDTDALERRVESRTNVLARTFDRVCGVLSALGYLHGKSGESVSGDGRRLARIYTESDLLVAECLREGVWEGLSAPELASAVSVLVYESRRDDGAPSPRLPGGAVREALRATGILWARLHDLEAEHRLSFLREPDPGFAWAALRWASGDSLDRVLDDDLAAGDFVRWTRQLIDLLDQIADVADGSVATRARAAVSALRRGVVAASPAA
jgi:ATP-dependent RNA helicase HelY